MAVPVGARRRQCLHRAMSSGGGSVSVTEVASSSHLTWLDIPPTCCFLVALTKRTT
jgi:hypothetical protein